MPPGAAANGQQANGEWLIVARAYLDGGLHPGKVRLEFGVANIPLNGQEVKATDYEVLVQN